MTLEQIRIFVAVAEREHLTQAATALNLTPSAVSSAIHALEQRYAANLFNRVGRRIELSPDGRAFLGEARAMLASAEAAEQALRELGGLARGRLSIAASQTIVSYWLPRALMRFASTYPAVAIALAEGNTTSVAAAVLEGRAELGFIEGAVDEPALSVTPSACASSCRRVASPCLAIRNATGPRPHSLSPRCCRRTSARRVCCGTRRATISEPGGCSQSMGPSLCVLCFVLLS